jgi:hypothetical protein
MGKKFKIPTPKAKKETDTDPLEQAFAVAERRASTDSAVADTRLRQHRAAEQRSDRSL